jgi:hypothetical protein
MRVIGIMPHYHKRIEVKIQAHQNAKRYGNDGKKIKEGVNKF